MLLCRHDPRLPKVEIHRHDRRGHRVSQSLRVRFSTPPCVFSPSSDASYFPFKQRLLPSHSQLPSATTSHWRSAQPTICPRGASFSHLYFTRLSQPPLTDQALCGQITLCSLSCRLSTNWPVRDNQPSKRKLVASSALPVFSLSTAYCMKRKFPALLRVERLSLLQSAYKAVVSSFSHVCTLHSLSLARTSSQSLHRPGNEEKGKKILSQKGIVLSHSRIHEAKGSEYWDDET